jgi:hypothetical protein
MRGEFSLLPGVKYQHTKERYSLDDLLEGVTPEHFNGEMDWGEPVGEEVYNRRVIEEFITSSATTFSLYSLILS